MTVDLSLVDAVRDVLAADANPERAVHQQAYMKSAMPYRGVTLSRLRTLLRPILAARPPVDRATWIDTIVVLWDEARFREEWYAAIVLARHPAAVAWRDPVSLPLWRHLVISGAWWDVVDEVATHLVGDVLARHRTTTTQVVLGWATDPDPWLRRTAVLAQVGHRAGTDVALLRAAIEANVADPSFWLRKAIGWALREYGKTDPDWVRTEVDRLGEALSPLSRREALKRL